MILQILILFLHRVSTCAIITLNDVYLATAELDGYGISYRESQLAIMVVGNILFKREWKINIVAQNVNDDDSNENENTYDCDTLPTKRAMRYMLSKIEASSLNLVAENLIEAKKEGHTITHSTDSTTRKVVGTYATAGLHIDNDIYLPLPTINVSRETTDNVVSGIKQGFELVAAASSHSSSELYAIVHCHMTDSTAHNKGIGEGLATAFDRDDVAG